MAKLHTLYDNFTAASRDASKWTEFSSSSTISQAAGQLAIVLANATAGTNYAGYTSASSFDITASYALVKIASPHNTSTGAETALTIIKDLSNIVTMVISGNTLMIIKKVAGVNTTLYSTTFNATTHRWWRIRESGGTTYFDVSSDPTGGWTTLTSLANPFTLTSVKAELSAGTYQSETSPGTAAFDNFNMFTITGEAITLDGSADVAASGKQTWYGEDVTLDGGADFDILAVTGAATSAPEKVYEYKMLDTSGNYLTSLVNEVLSDFDYDQDINTPGNGIEVEISRSADVLAATLSNLVTEGSENLQTEDSQDIMAVTASGAQLGAGSTIDLNYGIEVWVYYGYNDTLVDEDGAPVVDENGDAVAAVVGSPDGMRLFKGYISTFTARAGNSETTLLYCLPDSADLDQYVVKDGDTTNVPFNSYDPGAIVREVLDNFNSQGGSTTYDTSTVELSLTTVSYEFKLQTILEAIKQCLVMAPTNWYWYGDVRTNKVYFKPQPTDVTHTFVIGQHLKSIEVPHTIEGIVNDYYLVGGDMNEDPADPDYLFKHYEDTASQTAYRHGLQRDNDGRLKDPDSADIIGNSIIDTKKNPRYTATVTILANVYDIETIEWGQKVGFSNAGNYIDSLELQIVGLHYSPDEVTIKLDSLPPQPSKRLEDIKRNLQQAQTIDVPDTPS